MERHIEALERKLEIARYHLAELSELLSDSEPDQDGLPPIPLQAHFEACGRAVVAMPDQLASGVASVVSWLPAVYEATPRRVILALEASTQQAAAELLAVITRLDTGSRINDLRDVRNRSTHRFDEKEYLHGGGWIVLPPQYVPEGISQYEGSRRLDEYLQVMVDFGAEVFDEVHEVERLALSLAETAEP